MSCTQMFKRRTQRLPQYIPHAKNIIRGDGVHQYWEDITDGYKDAVEITQDKIGIKECTWDFESHDFEDIKFAHSASISIQTIPSIENGGKLFLETGMKVGN